MITLLSEGKPIKLPTNLNTEVCFGEADGVFSSNIIIGSLKRRAQEERTSPRPNHSQIYYLQHLHACCFPHFNVSYIHVLLVTPFTHHREAFHLQQFAQLAQDKCGCWTFWQVLLELLKTHAEPQRSGCWKMIFPLEIAFLGVHVRLARPLVA